ncbi:unnamed protein product [Linum trigynum]|uniref:Uncharacterized protein n=1 Tax=Linum trigynum TaxID=586398 RepID=A0AAV2D8C8_9ROSI
MIFSNFRPPGLPSRSFSSIVFGYFFTIALDNLAEFLHIPRISEALGDEFELPLFHFDYAEEFHALMGVLPAPRTFMHVSSLLPVFRMLHYCISRVFIPRTNSLDMVLPLDLWIIVQDVNDVPLKYTLFRLLRPYSLVLSSPRCYSVSMCIFSLSLHHSICVSLS